MSRVTLIDYDMGNLRSLANALKAIGADVHQVERGSDLSDAGHVILPGVGAFGASMRNLHQRGLSDALRNHVSHGRPLLGICLGFQVLFARGTENGTHDGLGLFQGSIDRFQTSLHVPHTGWNVLVTRPHPLFDGLGDSPHMYFVHSYRPSDVDDANIIGHSEYDGPFPCAVARDNVVGTQFHPERSGTEGLGILARFMGWRP